MQARYPREAWRDERKRGEIENELTEQLLHKARVRKVTLIGQASFTPMAINRSEITVKASVAAQPAP